MSNKADFCVAPKILTNILSKKLFLSQEEKKFNDECNFFIDKYEQDLDIALKEEIVAN